METGDLTQWEANTYQAAPCGGQFNSGPQAGTVASTEHARSGLWSAKMVIGGPPTGGATNGTRMYRWCEPQQHPDLFYSVWFYLPERLTVAPSTGWMNLFQFNSKLAGHIDADPFFFLDVFNAPGTGAMRFRLTWWAGQTSEGPIRGNPATGCGIRRRTFRSAGGFRCRPGAVRRGLHRGDPGVAGRRGAVPSRGGQDPVPGGRLPVGGEQLRHRHCTRLGRDVHRRRGDLDEPLAVSR